MTPAEQEAKRNRIISIAKWGGLALAVVLGLGIMGPLIMVGVKAGLALLAGGIVALGVANLAPVVGFRVANWKLKQIKAEAARNPVETLQLDYRKRQDALRAFKDAIQRFIAACDNFKDKVEDFKERYPAEAPKYQEKHDKMRELLKLRMKKYKKAEENLADYSLEIDKAGAIWEMAQEAAKLDAAAGMSDDDFYAEIKVKTAIDSVQRSLNDSFAQLEVALMEEGEDAADNKKLLEAHVRPAEAVIDVTPRARVEVLK